MMKLIVITSPVFLPGEAEAIAALFSAGLDLLHLRKPHADAGQVEELLKAIPSVYYSRIVIHDFFALKEKYGLRGIHLNSRHPEAPAGYCGQLSRSCHSLEEVAASTPCFDYVFMSPVYNSISKQGYRSGYSTEELDEAARKGLINSKVVALSGIDITNIRQVACLGFGGAALLGDIWSRFHSLADLDAVVAHLKALYAEIHS